MVCSPSKLPLRAVRTISREPKAAEETLRGRRRSSRLSGATPCTGSSASLAYTLGVLGSAALGIFQLQPQAGQRE